MTTTSESLQTPDRIGGHATQVAIKELGFAREKGDLFEKRVEAPRVGQQPGVGAWWMREQAG